MQTNKQIKVADIDVEIIKKTGIKNINLSVRPPNGDVRVTSSFFVSDAQIVRFVQSKMQFIEKNRDKVRQRERKAKENARKYVSGETFYLWGSPLCLQVVETDGKQTKASGQVNASRQGNVFSQSNFSGQGNASTKSNNSNKINASTKSNVSLESNNLVLRVPKNTSAQMREKKVMEWYRLQLTEAIRRETPKLERQIGVCAKEYRTKNMKTRWGTCNIAHARIWINLQLAKWPPECLEYILVHELCHLLEKNHTKRFWKLVETHCPEYKGAKKKLDSAVF